MLEKSMTHEAARQALLRSNMDIEGMDDLLGLYRDLADLTDKNAALIHSSRDLTSEEIQVRLLEGFTLLDMEDLLPGILDLASAATDVIAALARHSEDPASLKRDIAGLADDPSKLLKFARTFLVKGEKNLRNKLLVIDDVNPEVFIFVVFNSLKGQFLQVAERFRGVETSSWEQGYCPVCGGQPAVSYMIGEGGRRYLICFRCETNWRYRRLSCPFCGKDDPGNSGYLFSDSAKYVNLSASVCGNCNSYIKGWRIAGDDLGDLHPQIEDLVTPGFDQAIEEEGFSRGAPNIFGIWIGSIGEEGERED